MKRTETKSLPCGAGSALLLVALTVACSGGGGPVEPEVIGLEAVSGDDQNGLILVPLPDSLRVRVLTASGAPAQGVEVAWQTLGGTDSIFPETAITGPDGTAAALWTLGDAPGPDAVRAMIDGHEVRFAADGEVAEAGASREGRRGYVVYDVGDLPIILSAGHGGTLEPSEIPDRTEGTTVRDLDTDLLALAIADSLEARLGARPHLVISRLHRVKLDPNRELGEAAGGDPLAEHAWREYHGFIDHASARVEAVHDRGLYIDVHGHGHDIPRLELGYLLDAADLARNDDALDALATSSSIRALAAASPLRFSALIRGSGSLGTLFEEGGVPAVPSAAQPDPEADPFFSGGYATARHGSRDRGTVDGVQIEAHRPGLRDTAANRARFAGIAASVLEQWLEAHYGWTVAVP